MSKVSNIIRPANAIPRWPFTINRQSEQAHGLVGWWPMAGFAGSSALDIDVRCALNSAIGLPINCALPSGLPGLQTAGNTWTAFFSDLYSTDPLTLSCRISPTAAAVDQCVIAYTNGADFPLVVDLQSSSSIRAFRQCDSGYAIATGTYSGLNVESVVTATATGNAVSLYVDGKLQQTSTSGTGPFSYGSEQKVTTFRSVAGAGQYADIRIYNRALSAEEVWALYDPATRYELYQPLSRRIYGFAPSVAFTYKDASARLQALSGVKTSSSILRSASARLTTQSTVRTSISRAVAAHAEILARSTVATQAYRLAGASAKLITRSTVQATPSLLRGASVRIQSRASMQARASAWRAIAAQLQARSGILCGTIEQLSIAPGRLFDVPYEQRIFRVRYEDRTFRVPRA